MFQTKNHKKQNIKSQWYFKFGLFLISIIFFGCNQSKEITGKDLWPVIVAITHRLLY